MIRCSVVSLKFVNTEKKSKIRFVVGEYRRFMKFVIDELWECNELPKFLTKEISNKIRTPLSARLQQCAGKQALAIIKGTRQKQKRRLWQINKFKKSGETDKELKLQKIYNKNIPSKPSLKNVNMELDSRFVKLELESVNSFDGWLNLSSLGNKIKLHLPFKRHKHLNKLVNRGNLKQSIRLNEKELTIFVDVNKRQNDKTVESIGVDVGALDTISCSNGIQTKQDCHDHSLGTILKKLARKKKGSKAFERTAKHRDNFINWSVNQLNLKNVKELRIENIKDMRRGKSSSRFLSGWTYTKIFSKLERLAEEHDVHVSKVNPTYTSQRCSECGFVHKKSRKGKKFSCTSCGFSIDSDLNAAINIADNRLLPIKSSFRNKSFNHSGFFWLEGQEPIVPVSNKII